ncbi:uncharacterized protein CC84DRAFT_1261262 [Paraphaeosphaeria sporulosa]|uniref:Uncharacterized protein n=1 Tax=Paraphaeosphaeria sporulosa TaxID=1460663 RepID=A0A177C5V0_9PLEO|nr:uncharacterized protein CC84DRAFT_1261262 [Paraphaeosphaeria sporulosa]OAG02521.1 hypothetical protein CC84DRAFT_1261262 [Paraphaeosphaeria sporulosa]
MQQSDFCPIAKGYCINIIARALPPRRVFYWSSMCSILLLLFLISGVLSQSLSPVLEEPQRKHVLKIIEQALQAEDPVDPGLNGKTRVTIVIGTMLLLINLFCLYVIFLWIVYVFQKRGIRERYQRWLAARDLRLEQEEFLFRQGPEKKFELEQETEEKFNKVE